MEKYKKKKIAKKEEIKQKRYTAKCFYCGKEFNQDTMIKPCCLSIMVNDNKELRSYYIVKGDNDKKAEKRS